MAAVKEHYKKVQKVLWVVLALNWAVAVAKIIYGFISGSASMTADGFHSLSDGTSNIIGLVGIRFSSQPKDADHPYGHKKYETLFALGIAAMLLLVAYNLAENGVLRIIHPAKPNVTPISFIVMLVTIAVNIAVMFYEYRRGKQLKSDILVVDSMHTRADIFTSFSVIIALIGVKIGFPMIDPIITLIIAGFVAWSAFEIIHEEAGILCDTVAITETKQIEDIVLAVKGVKNCHKIRTRGRLDDIHLDLHVQVDGNMTLMDSHHLSHTIQTQIMTALPQVVDVLVHLEPDNFKKNS